MKHGETQSEDAEIEQAVSALLTCPRVEDAAKLCGISRTTLWRMAQQPEFKSRLQTARLQLSRDLVNSLQANALDAVLVLREVMQDIEASAPARVAAASKLLDLSLRAREQLELEERVTALEAALKLRKVAA
jgi:hypothetical protein